MSIPFVDLKTQYQALKPQMDAAMQAVIDNTAFIGGTYVKSFEAAYSEAYGVRHCIGVANGTDAIYIVLKALGIGPGDEVITVANSWISTSETISQTGATPVFVDIEPDHYTIDPALIEARITSRTKAIIPVHLYGQPAEMDPIMDIARRHDLHVIEDCAQAHFAEYRGKRVGTFGVAATFSFYPGKNLGAYGDAGAIVTNDDDLHERMRMFANHGALKKHEHHIEGINSRLDGLQAAVLSVKLPYIRDWNAARLRNARACTERLADIPAVTTPAIRDHVTHIFHLYVVRVPDREALQAHLNARGIGNAVHYPVALPLMPAYRYLGYSPEKIPVAAAYQSQILSLPMFPELSEEQIDTVCNAIREFYA